MGAQHSFGRVFDVQSANHREVFFSICIPQYNRTSFLLKAMESFQSQTFRSFEVCVSDGGSTDGRWEELVTWLKHSGLEFRFHRHERNLRYDANLRASIDLARGRYCLLMGNDDELATAKTLQFLHDQIVSQSDPGVVITNYIEIPSGSIVRRMRRHGNLGSGPGVAAANFRNYSFVSGVVLDREASLRHRTESWDGSEMYQMYLGTRIVAEGHSLLSLTEVVVRKDVQVVGEEVDSYARRPILNPCPIEPRPLPMNQIGMLVADALEPHLTEANRGRCLRQVFWQLLTYTYAYWIIQYRRVQSWRYSLGVCLAMTPACIMPRARISFATTLFIWVAYVSVTFAGLLTPIRLFDRLRPWLYALAKRA